MKNKLATWIDKQIKTIKKILGYKELTFKEKVQSMTAKEIIMTMVESLRNPVTAIQMVTYGHATINVETKKIKCYGCAATNFICRVSKIKPDKWINDRGNRARTLFGETAGWKEYDFLEQFESAINCLRMGDLRNYNYEAKNCGIATITNKHDLFLPWLEDDYTKKQLAVYVQLANTQ